MIFVRKKILDTNNISELEEMPIISVKTDFFLKAFIYLAVLSLSCDTWDLCCILLDHSLQPMGFSLIVTHGFSCGVLVPLPGIEPVSPELKSGLLTPGPPGKSLKWGLE